MQPAAGKNSWVYRRRLIFLTFALCAVTQLYLARFGVQDGKLHLLLAEGCLWIEIILVAIYVSGASVDDLVSLRLAMMGQQRTDRPAHDAQGGAP